MLLAQAQPFVGFYLYISHASVLGCLVHVGPLQWVLGGLAMSG